MAKLNEELKKEENEEKEENENENEDYNENKDNENKDNENKDNENKENENKDNENNEDINIENEENEKEEEEEIIKEEKKEKEEIEKKEKKRKKSNYAKKEAELAKERANKNKHISNLELICYFCFKKINSKNYVFHIHDCEAQWKIKNMNKDPSIFKPKDFDFIVSKVSALTKEQIENYNNNVLENKDGMTLIPCENCARNIMKCQMEEHLKDCKPFESYIDKKKISDDNKIVNEKKYDIDSYIKEEEETLASMELVPCEKCGRKFAPDRLPVHERGCKGKK